MPYKRGVGFDIQLRLVDDPSEVLHHLHDKLEHYQHGIHANKEFEPIRVFPRENIIHEDLRENRTYQTDKSHQQTGQESEKQRCPGALHPLSHKRKHGSMLSRWLELRSRLKGQHNAGKRAVKLLHIHQHPSAGGVVEADFVALETVEHDEVTKVPMQDSGILHLAQTLYLHAEAFRHHAVFAGRFQYIKGVAPIARHPAVDAQPLQGQPFLPIGQNHSQRGGATFQRLHLHHHRNSLYSTHSRTALAFSSISSNNFR